MKTIIAPSILAADFARLGDQIQAVDKAGADWIHVDVMDGQFVPNITIGNLVVGAVRTTTALPLDVHLMVNHPERQLDAFAEAGADWLTVHSEACTHLHRTLQHIRDLGKKAGVAYNPATPVDGIENIIELLDMVLIMTVNPGFGAQKFIPAMLPKIKKVRDIIDQSGRDIRLEVDGGIAPNTAPLVLEAGADTLVAGNAVYSAPDYQAAILAIRNSK